MNCTPAVDDATASSGSNDNGKFMVVVSQREQESSFSITVSRESKSWEVNRSSEEIATLLQNLRGFESEYYTSLIPEVAPTDAPEITIVLNSILSALLDEIWSVPSLLRFLDDNYFPSTISQLHIEFLSQKVADISAKFETVERKLAIVEASNLAVIHVLQKMQIAQLPTVASVSPSHPHTPHPHAHTRARSQKHQGPASPPEPLPGAGTSLQQSRTGAGMISPGQSGSTGLLGVGAGDHSEELAHFAVAMEAAMRSGDPRSSIISVLTADDSDLPVTAAGEHSQLPSPRSKTVGDGTGLDKSAHSLASFEGEVLSHSAPTIDGDSLSAKLLAADTSLLVKTAPVSPYISEDLLPSENISSYYKSAVNTLVLTLMPEESVSDYLSSVECFVKRQVRLALQSNTFPISLHEIGCALPDDPIAFSAIVSKSTSTNWHLALSERLCIVAERMSGVPGVSGLVGDWARHEAEEDEFLHNLPGDFSAKLKHSLTDVQHSKINVFKVSCMIDSHELDIVANNRSDLIFLAFLEEVSALVGQEHLFKRSLLLVRAWWSYETAAYVGTPIKHYLPDLALCVMLCAVFNQYHARISSPLQALCLFLAEYSGFDGNTQAITLQGLVPFKSSTSNQPVVIPPQEGHLIDAQLIEKYWLQLNVSYTPADQNELDYYKRLNSSSEDANGDSCAGVVNPHRAAAVAAAAAVAHQPVSPNSDLANMKSLSLHNQFHFDRQSFSIVHPFAHSNMMAEKLSSRRHMRLTKAFQIGASKVAVYLKQDTGDETHALDLLNFFPGTVTKFGERLQQMQQDVKEGSYDRLLLDKTFSRPTEVIWQNIRYCDIMLESVVTDTALLMLTVEILAIKGSLPVGEIGKILAEVTGIPNLSQKLKEKFGGLKKFLEHFQDKFVISNDHPFNPNVLLREALSAEHLELIDRGIFPHQLLAKSKRATAQPKKKKSFSDAGALIAGGYSGPGGAGAGTGAVAGGSGQYGGYGGHAGHVGHGGGQQGSKFHPQMSNGMGGSPGMGLGVGVGNGMSGSKYGGGKHSTPRMAKHQHSMMSPPMHQQSPYQSQQQPQMQQQMHMTPPAQGFHQQYGVGGGSRGMTSGQQQQFHQQQYHHQQQQLQQDSYDGGTGAGSTSGLGLGVAAQEFLPRGGLHGLDSTSSGRSKSTSAIAGSPPSSLSIIFGNNPGQPQHQYQQQHNIEDSGYFLGSVVDMNYSDLLGSAGSSGALGAPGSESSGVVGGGGILNDNRNNSSSMLSSLRVGTVEISSGGGVGEGSGSGGTTNSLFRPSKSTNALNQSHTNTTGGGADGAFQQTYRNLSSNSLASEGSHPRIAPGPQMGGNGAGGGAQGSSNIGMGQILPETRFASYLPDYQQF